MIRMYNQSILARPKHRDIENMFVWRREVEIAGMVVGTGNTAVADLTSRFTL